MKLKKFDAVDFLDSDEAMVEYLNAALEEDDPRYFAHALGNVARAKGMSSIDNPASAPSGNAGHLPRLAVGQTLPTPVRLSHGADRRARRVDGHGPLHYCFYHEPGALRLDRSAYVVQVRPR